MINQILKYTVRTEHVDVFRKALIENKIRAQQEDGALEMRLFEDTRMPNIFIVYERWADQAALESHAESAQSKHLAQLADAMSQVPAEVMRLSETVPAPLYDTNPKMPNPDDELFIIFFIFKIKDGYRERLLRQFEKHVAHTRQEDGCILFDLYSVDGAVDTLAVYEHWRRESDVWDVHFNMPYSVETGALMHEAVVGDMGQYMNFVKEFG